MKAKINEDFNVVYVKSCPSDNKTLKKHVLQKRFNCTKHLRYFYWLLSETRHFYISKIIHQRKLFKTVRCVVKMAVSVTNNNKSQMCHILHIISNNVVFLWS